jgi:hypothetical protein
VDQPEQMKRRFQDADGREWWAYQTQAEMPVQGMHRILTFCCPSEQVRERLAWPDGLADLRSLDEAQLRALLPVGESVPEQPRMKVRLRSEDHPHDM